MVSGESRSPQNDEGKAGNVRDIAAAKVPGVRVGNLRQIAVRLPYDVAILLRDKAVKKGVLPGQLARQILEDKLKAT